MFLPYGNVPGTTLTIIYQLAVQQAERNVRGQPLGAQFAHYFARRYNSLRRLL